MDLQTKLKSLANETSQPCVTLSLNTHRTYPDNRQDEIAVKNLVKEAKNRIKEKYDDRKVEVILEKLDNISDKIDYDYNLDSLHIFISKDTEEIIKAPISIDKNDTYVDDTFAVKPLIKVINQCFEYLVLVLKKAGVPLYEAMNDSIIDEVKNDDFPFDETPYYAENEQKKSDGKYMDNLDREYFNNIDKAVQEISRDKNLKVVVVSTEDNYSKLQQVADNADTYIGHADINYNELKEHQIAEVAYKVIKDYKVELRQKAIGELKEAVSQSNVMTDLNEIYRAAIDGRAELLIVKKGYEQPVKMIDDRNFEQVEDAKEEGIEDDIVSNIAWEVLDKGGRVIFTSDSSFDEFGNIALKVRY